MGEIISEEEYFDEKNGILYSVDSFIRSRKEPSVFNGMVNVEKFKITIERIEEPDEVIIQRCREMYNKEKNMHNRDSIIKYLDSRFGDGRKLLHSKNDKEM